MIPVNEAKTIIAANALHPNIVSMALESAAGNRLAESIYSAIDVPSFVQSSMDGFAFKYADLQECKSLKVVGEIAAGADSNINLKTGEAVRIFTGAGLPAGADTVVMQEKAVVSDGILSIIDPTLKAGLNVRLPGTEIRTGGLALISGAMLTAGAIGFLASIGITHVNSYASPLVTIIVTGNELQQPGQPLLPGQVYECNSFSLKAALETVGIDHIRTLKVPDNLSALTLVLQEAVASSDLILLTGGVSVGDYDFVLQAAQDAGIEHLFHGVKQKPGKPLYFGKKENKLIFGLPGNPSSVLTCFYQYVCLALPYANLQHLALPVRAPIARQLFERRRDHTFFKGLL